MLEYNYNTLGICSSWLSKIICLRYAFTTCKLHRTACFCPIQYILPAKVVFPCFFLKFPIECPICLYSNMASSFRIFHTFFRILVIFQQSTSKLRLLQPLFRAVPIMSSRSLPCCIMCMDRMALNDLYFTEISIVSGIVLLFSTVHVQTHPHTSSIIIEMYDTMHDTMHNTRPAAATAACSTSQSTAKHKGIPWCLGRFNKCHHWTWADLGIDSWVGTGLCWRVPLKNLG